MGSYPLDYYYPAPVSNLYNQPVRITFDIEDHPVISQEVSRFKSPLYILGRLPCLPLNFIAPRIQLSANI
jgi:hypothetical protein